MRYAYPLVDIETREVYGVASSVENAWELVETLGERISEKYDRDHDIAPTADVFCDALGDGKMPRALITTKDFSVHIECTRVPRNEIKEL